MIRKSIFFSIPTALIVIFISFNYPTALYAKCLPFSGSNGAGKVFLVTSTCQFTVRMFPENFVANGIIPSSVLNGSQSIGAKDSSGGGSASGH